MRIALDTNILAYAEGIDDAEREVRARHLIDRLPRSTTYLPAHVLGELFNVLVRRGFSAERAQTAVADWREAFSVIAISEALIVTGIALAVRHRFRIWDSLVLAAACDAACSILLSEDFQEGFTWQGVTVCNPFLPKPHPLIADLVRE